MTINSIVWHIVAGEYPPQPGGVSDYTFILATKLAKAGDEVHVWAPATDLAAAEHDADVTVHRLPGHFGALALAMLHRSLKAEKRPYRFLVQYVPHMYGMKNMNLLFAFWLRALCPVAPWIMFHEVAFPIVKGQPLKHRILAHVQRTMARWIATGMAKGFASVPCFGANVKTLAPKSPDCQWLPVPSNVATQANVERVAEIRRRLAPDPSQRVVGHFGTYGDYFANALTEAIKVLAESDPRWRFLLIGRGSREFAARFAENHADLGDRLYATGPLDPVAVAEHLSAADVLYQPYADGISSRRGSAMAGLALGLPIVTISGNATEPVWLDEKLVRVVPDGDRALVIMALLECATLGPERNALMECARQGYIAHFSWDRLVAILRR